MPRHRPANKGQEKWADPYLRDRRCMSARALALARVYMRACVRVSSSLSLSLSLSSSCRRGRGRCASVRTRARGEKG